MVFKIGLTMSKRIFITATNTNIGKTYTAKLLLEAYSARCLKVCAFKPVESGAMDDFSDGEELLRCSKQNNPTVWSLEVDDIVGVSFSKAAAPFIASGGKKLDIELILKKLLYLESMCDVVIIEGAGGLYTPLDGEMMIVDLIDMLNAATLLVTHCSLGCINDTLLSKELLKKHNIRELTVFNCVGSDDNFNSVSKPYFDHIGIATVMVNRDIDTICDVLYNL